MANSWYLTLTSYLFFFITGFFINISGAVTPSIALSMGTTTAAIGYGFSAFMVGRALAIFSNGYFLKEARVNKEWYIRILMVLVLLLSVSFWLAGNFLTFIVLVFCSGLAIGGLYSSSNMILVDIYTGKEKAFHISTINFLYSIGGVASPLVTGFLLKQGYPWQVPYLIITAIVTLLLLGTMRARYGVLYRDQEGREPEGRLSSLKPAMWKVSVAIVAYILAEYSITYWTPVFMVEALGKDLLFAGSCVSTLWVAVLLGRFAHSMLVAKIQARKYILGSAVLAMASLIAFQTLSDPRAILAASFMGGLFCAGLFPALFIFGTDQAQDMIRTIPTVMMLSAATGSFIAMPLGSLVKTIGGVRAIMIIPILALGTLFALILSTKEKP